VGVFEDGVFEPVLEESTFPKDVGGLVPESDNGELVVELTVFWPEKMSF
jgi:hypothetical protein